MDVIVPPIPATYDEYRSTLRAFLADHKPTLEWKQRTGLRVPETAADVDRLRAYVRAINDAGYVLARFSTEPGDPYEQRILEQELGAAGVPARARQSAGGRGPQALRDRRATRRTPAADGPGRPHLDPAVQ